MAADPTLADRVLADQLERHAAQRFVGEPVSGMCRAAAVRLRKLDAIEEAARSAVREIRGSHYRDPLIRSLCVVCGAADGSYPCSALVEAGSLSVALGGTDG